MPTIEHTVPSSLLNRGDYRPLQETEAWIDRTDKIGSGIVRVVRFISTLNEDVSATDRAQLIQLDHAARDEADKSGKLEYYHAGDIDENGQAESWCTWTDAAASHNALHGPDHRKAVSFALGRQVYKSIQIEIMDASINKNGEYDLEIIRVLHTSDIVNHTKITQK